MSSAIHPNNIEVTYSEAEIGGHFKTEQCLHTMGLSSASIIAEEFLDSV